MIHIECPEHFASVVEFAVNNGCTDKLMERLRYLATYADGEGTCCLHKDWAPNSFEFVMYHKDGTRWFNGGLIYSGPGQPLNGSAPALTVGIGVDCSVHGWSVHT